MTQAERFYLNPTHMIFRDLYTTEYEGPSHFYISQIGLLILYCRACMYFRVWEGGEGKEEKKGEVRPFYLPLVYFVHVG